MKKFYKVLSAAALGALFATGVVATASCGGDSSSQVNSSTLESAAKLVEVGITNDGAKVSADFSLPATVTEYGKTYQINWVSDNTSVLSFTVAYQEDGTKYFKTIITRAVDKEGQPENPEYAAVTYHAVLTDPDTKETKTTTSFKLRVLKEVPASVTYSKWVNGGQELFDVEGYVLAKVGYNESYKEANIIVWDNEAKGAYFIYQCYLDKEVYDALEGGEKVSVTNATRSVYNGLIETKYGATAKVDTKAEKLDISTLTTDITSLVKGYSDEANQTALMYLQSSKVSLKQVKVVKKNDSVATSNGKYDTTMTNVVTVSVGGQELEVNLYQGFTAFSADSTKELVSTLQGKLDSYVDLEGYLSWGSSGPVFIINSKDAIKDSTEPVDDKVQADLDEASASVETSYATSPEDITLPTKGTNGSELSYAVKGEGAKLEGNTLTLKVGETKQVVELTITGKLSGTTLTKTVKIALGVSDEDIAKEALDALSFEITEAVTRKTLVTTGDNGVTYEYVVKESADGAVEKKDDKLIVIAGANAKTAVVTVTAKKGDAEVNKDITISIPAYTLTTLDKVNAGKDNNDQALTSNNSYVVVEGYVSQSYASNTWYISTEKNDDKTLMIYYVHDNYDKNVTNVNDLYPVGTKVVLWGLYYDFVKNDVSTKELKNVVVLNYEISNEDQAQINVNSAAKLFETEYYEAKEITIPEGVTASVTSTGTTSVVVEDGKVKITPTATSETVTVTLSSTVGDATKTKEVTFTSVLSTVKKVTLQASETKDVEDGDITSDLTTDANISITVANGSSTNKVKLTNEHIRLYVGTSITIAAKTGYTIKSITVTYDSGYIEATIKNADGTEVKAENNKYVLNSSSVSLNNNGSKQARITSLVVEYDVAA